MNGIFSLATAQELVLISAAASLMTQWTKHNIGKKIPTQFWNIILTVAFFIGKTVVADWALIQASPKVGWLKVGEAVGKGLIGACMSSNVVAIALRTKEVGLKSSHTLALEAAEDVPAAAIDDIGAQVTMEIQHDPEKPALAAHALIAAIYAACKELVEGSGSSVDA